MSIEKPDFLNSGATQTKEISPGGVQRIPFAVEKLREQAERLKEIKLRPRVGILTDKDKIENQQVDVIDSEDQGVYQVSFKLTESWYIKILEKFQKFKDAGDASIGRLGYSSFERPDREFLLTNAFVVKSGIASIRVSMARLDFDDVLSAKGLIQIEIPKSEVKDIKNVEGQIAQILKDFFEIEDGLEPPGPEEERNYKIARYMWHHKLETFSDTEAREVEIRMKRKEVFPGYFTFVDEGKNSEYKTISPFAIIHQIRTPETLPQIVKAGGLMCTHERYRRGLLYDGMSSAQDLVYGGGDSVFTRAVTVGGLDRRRREDPDASVDDFLTESYIIFSPTILDRTDWYAYDQDRYGRIRSDVFQRRQSPKQVFEDQKKNFDVSNEQMFRLGISLNDFRAITAPRIRDAVAIIKVLEDAGIRQINGVPVQRFVFITKSADEAIKISMGQETQAKTFEQISIEQPEEIEKIIFPDIFQFFDRINHAKNEIQNFGEDFGPEEILEVLVGMKRLSVTNFGYILEYFKNAPDKYKNRVIDELNGLYSLFQDFYKKIVDLFSEKKKLPLEDLSAIIKTHLEAQKDLKIFIEEFKNTKNTEAGT